MTSSSSRRLKLMHLTRCEEMGIRVFLRGMLSWSDAKRFDTTVVSPIQGPLAADCAELGTRNLRLNIERDIKPLADLRSLFALWALVRREKPDVLHLHCAKPGFIGRIVGRLAGVPAVVYTPNNDYLSDPMSPLRRWVLVQTEKFAARMSGTVVAVTTQEMHTWIDRGICTPDRLLTIHDGFDVTKAATLIDREEAMGQLGLPVDSQIVGMIARLWPQKAPDVFVKAAARVLERRPDVHFLLVGEGPLSDPITRLVADLGIADRFHLLGHVNGLSPIYSAMDVSVLTSAYEGLPMVLLESMYLQIPVVITRTHGIEEVVTPECGVITPPNCPEQTAAAILKILKDGDLARSMGRNARQRVLTGFTAQKMTAAYETLYLRLLGLEQQNRVAAGA